MTDKAKPTATFVLDLKDGGTAEALLDWKALPFLPAVGDIIEFEEDCDDPLDDCPRYRVDERGFRFKGDAIVEVWWGAVEE